MADSQSNNKLSESGALTGNAAELIKGLSGVYLEYAKQNSLRNPKRGFNMLFERWFRLDPHAIEPLHKEFLGSVTHFVTKLALALERMKDSEPEVCGDYAGRALGIMFAPKPDKQKTDADRYLVIAEYESVPLFSYASRDDLQGIRDELLKRTPRRFMFPKQLEMVELIEKIISEKRDA